MLQLFEHSQFGMLYGAGVAPLHRGKGFYRASITARVNLARSRGIDYLLTEARDTSKPILEALGFIPLSTETTWVLPDVD